MTHTEVFQAIYAALAALPALQGAAPADTRVYPRMIPQGVQTFPAAVYSRINSTPDATICGADEAGDDLRIQIDLYGPEFAALSTLRFAAVDALQGISTFPCRRISDNAAPFEPDGRLFRESFDVICSLSNT